MVKYLKENGYPCDLTLDVEETLFKYREGYKVTIKCNGEVIEKFFTDNFPNTERKYYARGFLKVYEILNKK